MWTKIEIENQVSDDVLIRENVLDDELNDQKLGDPYTLLVKEPRPNALLDLKFYSGQIDGAANSWMVMGFSPMHKNKEDLVNEDSWFVWVE